MTIEYRNRVHTPTQEIRIHSKHIKQPLNNIKGGFHIVKPKYHSYIISTQCHICKKRTATHRTRLKYYQCNKQKCFNVMHPTCEQCKNNINKDKW